MDYTALHTEISTDPLALGYAPYVAAGNDGAIAVLLNAPTGVGAATISITTLSRGAVLRGVIPATDQLASGLTLAGVAIPTAVSNKWASRFAALRGADPSMAMDAILMGMLGQLVTDGLMTQPYIDAFTKRIGSRAEVLWGMGTIIQWRDVAAAYGRTA